MKKILITSALPYVNNIPHLGNLIQVLSADVFARSCRLAGRQTLYVCATDEYGTATETKALEEGISPRELCDRYHAIHCDIYDWFNIAFDKFGRTSCDEHTKITQDIFLDLDKNGYINERVLEQLYCEVCARFLADRYVRGVCPHCGYGEARGDQCENCGKLLEPTELVEPRCGVCGGPPKLKETKHLYIDLPAVRPKLEAWLKDASVRGFWAKNAVKMTEAWIRDGLKERAITRDLKWGIPVPKKGFEDKVFYVWFDAPIGYISVTAAHTKDWEKWWRNPEEVELYQFIGKDNIPFHTVIFPSSLLGSGKKWTMLHHMSSTEYLNYESGKFSKSKGIGVFGTDARDTGIPADVWRFYVFYNRPETSDTVFTWKDFQEKVNSELIGNLGNLVNRTLTFAERYYDGKVPAAPDSPADESFWKSVADYETRIKNHYARAELRDAFREVLALSSYGNKAFQDGEPWKTRTTEPEKAAVLLHNLIYLVRDLSILAAPVLPATAEKIASFLGLSGLGWKDLLKRDGVSRVSTPEILFRRIEDKEIEELRERFSGSQKERKERADAALEKGAAPSGGAPEPPAASTNAPTERVEDAFSRTVRLVVAKIVKIERHPGAEKLYIETVDTGGGERQIVSGLVPHYKEEELLGKNILLVANLKPAKLRGVVSNGMLLAAESDGVVEVLFAPDAEPGTAVVLKGSAAASPDIPAEIDIDRFFSIPLHVKDGLAYAGETPLVAADREIRTHRVPNGKVG
jgi:methionyl-tRNA synthetase